MIRALRIQANFKRIKLYRQTGYFGTLFNFNSEKTVHKAGICTSLLMVNPTFKLMHEWIDFGLFCQWFSTKSWKKKEKSKTKTYKKIMRNSVLKTVKIQILRIRFLRHYESIFFAYNEKAEGLWLDFLRGEY